MKLPHHLLYALALGTMLAFAGPADIHAQQNTSKDTASKSGAAMQPTLTAVRLQADNNIDLDGKLDEAIWGRAMVASGFTQRAPNDGQAATEETEARVIYTNEAIYVGIKAYDSAMDSIAATLFRKDGGSYSDWVYVGFDSYNDNLTSFNFAVNPKGVRKDILIYNDDSEDIRWDAVWEAKTSIQDDGWTAEIRIPLSQLRYSTNNDKQTWGVNFQRRIARKQEISFWSPTPQQSSGIVSKFGNLEGIQDLKKPTRLELIPYASSNLVRAPSQPDNPFYEANNITGSFGGDVKYGLTSDLTLTATINPDFGQVEADPAVINLSAFETFYPEQRPFFLEGNEIFRFGETKSFNTFGNPITFYSRRIGRAPQGNLGSYNRFNNNSVFDPANNPSTYTDRPDQTTIAGAAKVSGKTQNGWSVGFLDAYTVNEEAAYRIMPNGINSSRGSFPVEPATNYLVARAKKDFNGANSVLGGFLSATNRSIGESYFQQFLHKSAYIAGVDFEHNWDNRNWVVSGAFSSSQVNGSREAIHRTQLSPVRYFNRVDSEKLSVDPGKTSLGGYAGELSIRKSGGEHWRTSVTYSQVSPGYETNDLGFQNRSDYRAIATSLMYRETSPDFFRFYNIWSFQTFAWNYDGDMIGNFYNIGGFWEFKNLWSFNANVNFAGKQFTDRITRGGPVADRPRNWNFNMNISSDQTKKISFNLGTFNLWELPQPNIDREYDHAFWAGIQLRPATNLQISLMPQFSYGRDTDQYVTAVADPLATGTFGRRYVFANIDQTTLSTNVRVDWTFTPDISFQLYARPFVTSGNYSDYKEFTTPRDYTFDIYGRDTGTITHAGGHYTVDPDGAGPADSFSFSERDFNFRSVQTNAVFRWEYAPGSTLFLVWQQDRRSFEQHDDFRFRRDFGGLVESDPTNVFLVKLSYWFGT